MAGLNFAPALVERENCPDGAFILRSTQKLQHYAATLCEFLDDWAKRTPHSLFLAERDGASNWREVTFEKAQRIAMSIAQELLNRKIPAGRPIMIVSDNSIDHALLMLGGFLQKQNNR